MEKVFEISDKKFVENNLNINGEIWLLACVIYYYAIRLTPFLQFGDSKTVEGTAVSIYFAQQ